MNKKVLDASVVLAILKEEVRDTAVAMLIDDAFVSSVNWCEVLTTLAENSASDFPRQPTTLLRALHSIQDFTVEQAKLAAGFRQSTKSAGLSLGDRACLALGAELDADIYTADRAWATLDLPLRIHVIR